MIVYVFLLIIIAVISYGLGCMSTIAIASNFIFHTNLNKLGKGNIWLSNFSRIYGVKGAIALFAVELLKDILPVLFGGLLLSLKGHGDAGREFAAFCVIMGRSWPVLYDLKGSSALVCLFVAALFAGSATAAFVILVGLGVLLGTRYLTFAAAAAGIAMLLMSLIVVDDSVVRMLGAFCGAAVLVHHIPALRMIFRQGEEKISFKADLSYKFDE